MNYAQKEQHELSPHEHRVGSHEHTIDQVAPCGPCQWEAT